MPFFFILLTMIWKMVTASYYNWNSYSYHNKKITNFFLKFFKTAFPN